MTIQIHEVGLRDGLQIEPEVVPLSKRREWALEIARSGIPIIQLGSFVHPKKVPQMADTDELVRLCRAARPDKVIFSGLVLNEKGVERGLACGIDLFCMGISASETHGRKNTGMEPEEALRRTLAMAREVFQEGKAVQASIQSAFGCGFEGEISPERVVEIAEAYLSGGIREISLADTAGHAHPDQVENLVDRVRALSDEIQITCHLHDTYGLGLANCWSAVKAGVSTLECSFGGLGGCPFTQTAGGNVCTEDLVHSLQRLGLCREIDLATLRKIAAAVARHVGRELPGKIYRTGTIRQNIENTAYSN